MDVRSLMPWNRDRNLPASRYLGESPLLTLHREMNRMFDDFFRGFDMPAARGAWSGSWPNVELSETDNEVRVVAELPGLTEKDVEVTVADNVLTLRGEKKAENESPTYTERWHGRFQRSIPLAAEVDVDRIDASFKNGVLTVVLPKRPAAESQQKKIEVKAA